MSHISSFGKIKSIPELRLILDFQGKQSYLLRPFGFGPDERFAEMFDLKTPASVKLRKAPWRT